MLSVVGTRPSVARSIWEAIVEHMPVNALRASLRSSFAVSAPSQMEQKHSSHSLTAALFCPLCLGCPWCALVLLMVLLVLIVLVLPVLLIVQLLLVLESVFVWVLSLNV